MLQCSAHTVVLPLGTVLDWVIADPHSASASSTFSQFPVGGKGIQLSVELSRPSNILTLSSLKEALLPSGPPIQSHSRV